MSIPFSFVNFNTIVQGSESGDPAPPAPPDGGGGNTGGGGSTPDFYYYYIPLIFNESHKYGESEVTVWLYQPGIISTSFQMDSSGVNSQLFSEPVEISFRPSTSLGLQNGSYITTSAPAQVVGKRFIQDIERDISFSYTILPARMMGFEFRAPFDGIISIFTQSANTTIHTEGAPSGGYQLGQFTTIELEVKESQYINSSQPTLGAFYSDDSQGLSATLGVPLYLQGNKYLFSSEISAPRDKEIDFSFINIIPETPTEIYLQYENNSLSTFNIFRATKIQKLENIVGISARRGSVTISLETIYSYGKITRRSTVTLIASEEMRSGELFTIPEGFSSHFVVINDNTNFTSGEWFDTGYIQSAREFPVLNSGASLTFSGKNNRNVFFGNHSLFGVSVSPGYRGHPMSPSASFVSLPLNSATLFRNVSGIEATWYRYANLAVENITILPHPPEDFTGIAIAVTFISNGSIPSGAFTLTIDFLGENQLTYSQNFIQANRTLVFELKIFLDYNIKAINVSAEIDTLDQVNEIVEEDNLLDVGFDVQSNFRIIFTFYLVIAIILALVIWRIVSYLKNNRRSKSSRYDAILIVEPGD